MTTAIGAYIHYIIILYSIHKQQDYMSKLSYRSENVDKRQQCTRGGVYQIPKRLYNLYLPSLREIVFSGFVETFTDILFMWSKYSVTG